MRIRRTNFLIATMISALLALAFAGAAMADAGSGETSATGSSTTTTDTKTPVDTNTPVDTSTTTTSKPQTDTKAPVTEAPKPVTETPKTVTPECGDSGAFCQGSTEKPELPEEPSCADTPAAADCVPDTPVREDIPDAPGGGDLPFTGPGDVVLAIVLALLAGTGGILFLFGASGREQLDSLNRRGMDSPSGFQLAYRELRKQQLRD